MFPLSFPTVVRHGAGAQISESNKSELWVSKNSQPHFKEAHSQNKQEDSHEV